MAPTVTDDEAATGAGELQPTGTPAVPAASRPRQPRAHVPAWLATRRAAVAVLMIGTVGPGAALVAREQSQGSINTSGLVYCQKGHAVDFVHVVSEAGAVSAEVLWRHDNQAFIQTPVVSSGWTVVVGCSASQSGPAYRGRGELTVAAARADWFCGRFERAGSRLCWQVVTDREATAAGPAPGRSRTDPARQDTEKPDTSSPMDAPRATRTPAASETPSATPIAMVAR